jgi:hypothetical protein
MNKEINETDKEFLTTILNECIQQIRTSILYVNSPKEISKSVNNITHIREIAKKLDLKHITPKLN